MKREALWRKVVDHKYGSMWGLQGSCGVSLWKIIRKGCEGFNWFSFKVGDGSSI